MLYKIGHRVVILKKKFIVTTYNNSIVVNYYRRLATDVVVRSDLLVMHLGTSVAILVSEILDLVSPKHFGMT